MADNLDSSTGSEASDLDILEEGSNDEKDSSEETSEVSEEESGESESEEDDSESDEPTGDPDEEEEVETKALDEDEEEEEDSEITRPSWKEIKEKFPEIAKNPDFREMYHREKAYSEVFPTVADARDSAEKSNLFDYFDESLSTGDPGPLLRSLNEGTIQKFTDNFLPALYQLNPQLFVKATSPVLIEVLHNLDEKASRSNDKNLKISVQNISKHVFGNFDIPPRAQRNRDPELEREREEVKQERENLIAQSRNNFLASSDKSIKRQLTEIVSENLDPKGVMSEFTKKALIQTVLDETRNNLKSDKAFASKIQQLLRLAERSGYSPDYKPRIISAYLGRAKTIALSLRAKHRAAAIGKRAPVNKNRIESTRAESNSPNSNSSKGKVDYRKKSDLDIIMEGS